MFAVVEFENDDVNAGNELAVVPALWLHRQDRRCYWPNRMNNKKFETIVKNNEAFKSTWPSYRVHKVHKKTDRFEEAEEFLDDLLRESRSEAELSGRSTVTLGRKTLIEEEDADEESPPTQQRNTPVQQSFASSSSSLPSTVTILSDNLSIATKLSNLEETINKILERVTTTETFVDQQHLILSELLRNSRAMVETNTDKIEAPVDLPRFPISCNEDFNRFNERLQQDQIFYKYMVTRLAAVGGSGIESVTRRILKYLLADSVAQNYNWKGREKLAFEKIPTMNLIYESAKLNFPSNERSDMVIANTVKDWLKFAKTRLINVQKKQK